jgi:hypothetical protein
MNRLFRIVSAFVVVVVAMLVFTVPARAAYTSSAQPTVQRRDEKGRWMKAVPAKTWAPRISGFIVGASRLGVGAAKPTPGRTAPK